MSLTDKIQIQIRSDGKFSASDTKNSEFSKTIKFNSISSNE